MLSSAKKNVRASGVLGCERMQALEVRQKEVKMILRHRSVSVADRLFHDHWSNRIAAQTLHDSTHDSGSTPEIFGRALRFCPTWLANYKQGRLKTNYSKTVPKEITDLCVLLIGEGEQYVFRMVGFGTEESPLL